MELTDILHSVHEYDRDGDICDEGIFLHFGDTRVKVAMTPEEFKKVVDRISGMINEITESYERFPSDRG